MKLFSKKNNTTGKSSKYDREMSLSISGISSRADWIATVLLVLTILILLLFFSWRLFVGVDTGTYLDKSVDTTKSKNIVDVERLNRVVDMFELRAQRFNQLTNGMVLSGISAKSNVVEDVSTTTPEATDNSNSEDSFDQ